MKRLFVIFTVFLILLMLAQGCVMIDSSLGVGPGNSRNSIVGSTRLIILTFGFGNFTRIHLSNFCNARIEQGSSYSVTVETDDNIEQYVKATQVGNEIFIGLDEQSYSNVTMNVVIRTPDMSLIEASGASVVNLVGVNVSHRVDLIGSGASVFKGNLIAQEVAMQLSGSTSVDLAGNAGRMTVNGSGATTLRLFGFPVGTCKANLSGASLSDVSVSDTLEVNLSGGSVFRYKGNPYVRVIGVSGGSVIQRIF